MIKSKFKRIITWTIALLIGCCAALCSYFDFFGDVDTAVTNWVYDHTFFLKSDDHITLIAIDEKSKQLYGDYNTWPRSLLATAVTTLSEEQAAIIGLDLDLSEASETDAAGDAALAEACKEASNVIAAANAVYDDAGSPAPKQEKGDSQKPKEAAYQTTEKSNPPSFNSLNTYTNIVLTGADSSVKWEEQNITEIVYPFDELLDDVNIGIANATQLSNDGLIRNAALTVKCDDMTYDSFASAVYKAYQNFSGKLYTFSVAENTLFGFHTINDCQVISFTDLLSGSYDSSLIAGNIILIGEYDHSETNRFSDFLHPNRGNQDLIIQASIIQALLDENIIVAIDPVLQALLFGFLTAVFYLFAVNRKLWVTILSHFIILGFFVSIGYLLNSFGYCLMLLTPMLFFPCIIFFELLERTLISIYEKKKMEWTLKMYVDSQVVDELSKKSVFELATVSERRHIAVLFVDIRGFTTISESLEPEQVVEILNEYLSLVAEAIAHWGGTLDKFIGDAAMAIFNAPKDQEDYVFHAVCAAAEIIQSSGQLRSKFEKRFGKTVSFGIGINCGDAIVGNIGCLSHMDYTAIGDTVNVASRLEAMAEPGQVLVSESVMDAIASRVNATEIGPLALKGKTKTVTTYQIDQIMSLPDSSLRGRKGILLEKTILHS